MKINLVFLLVSILGSYSLAAKVKFDKPQKPKKISMGKSADAEGEVEFLCWSYQDFAVTEINDPAIKGAKDISLRPAPTKGDVCAQEYKGKTISLARLAGEYYFQGAKGKYLFFESADTFGNQLQFQILSADKGKKIFSGNRNETKDFLLEGEKLEYHMALSPKCLLAQEGAPCSEKILKENKVPSTVKLQEPDCKSSFEKGKSPLDNRVLVSIPVMVENLAKPKIVFVDGLATCEPSP